MRGKRTTGKTEPMNTLIPFTTKTASVDETKRILLAGSTGRRTASTNSTHILPAFFPVETLVF
jgi:hypothetical protein